MPDSTLPQVLLVEDEPLIRVLASDMLDALGYVVVEAATGGEALALEEDVLKGLAGLIIDLGLPDQPGQEVARRLRERRPGLPVILTTGADASAAKDGLAPGGPVWVLEKPYQFSDMSDAVGILAKA